MPLRMHKWFCGLATTAALAVATVPQPAKAESLAVHIDARFGGGSGGWSEGLGLRWLQGLGRLVVGASALAHMEAPVDSWYPNLVWPSASYARHGSVEAAGEIGLILLGYHSTGTYRVGHGEKIGERCVGYDCRVVEEQWRYSHREYQLEQERKLLLLAAARTRYLQGWAVLPALGLRYQIGGVHQSSDPWGTFWFEAGAQLAVAAPSDWQATGRSGLGAYFDMGAGLGGDTAAGVRLDLPGLRRPDGSREVVALLYVGYSYIAH